MKQNVGILDCTLRDGGYINDWKFGHETLVSVFSHLVSAGVDFVELGFLDGRQPFSIDRSIMPRTECMAAIYGEVDKKGTQTVGMIDYGTCSIENIQPCAESYIDGIRVIFKKHLRVEAMEFCRQIKALGYKVFSQAVSITSYTDDELLDLIRLANEVEPYALSIVDTYGLLHKKQLFHYYTLMNDNLRPGIGIGYHAHNNFQLGYANCIELISLHGDNERQLLCDGSVFGMGKGAGNAPTELLAMYMNQNCGTHYDISHLLEAIDVSVLDIFKHSSWGYQLKFFIAASNDCHPSYVNFLLEKKSLSVKAINEILTRLDEEKKLMYDQAHIERLYVDYQSHDCDDTESYRALGAALQGRELLLIGPGSSIERESEVIRQYIAERNPLVIAVNFVPEAYKVDYVFLSNSKRYVQQVPRLSADGSISTIATSNLADTGHGFDYRLDYASLVDRESVTPDNSFVMMLKVLRRMGVKNVACAGFDGYTTDNKQNFYLTRMEYDFVTEIWHKINSYVRGQLEALGAEMNIEFLTKTKYVD